jgi:nucleoside-diphosphate-sugar epimerase
MSIERILLTGAAGFLGRALLRELEAPLRSEADPLREIRLLDWNGEGLPEAEGYQSFVGSVTDEALLARACEGVDAVLHAASIIDWGQTPRDRVREVNVTGTERIIEAARRAGVPTLVYTSSMDVVCGKRPVVEVDESVPYPDPFMNVYSETKALAEQSVLAAHGRARARRPGESGEGAARLATCAIRPCGMYGERDPYHVANIVKVVRDGSLSVRPGDGHARFEHVYVGNVAHAHLLAMRRLHDGDASVGGRAYFITDDSPVLDFLEFMEPIIEGIGLALPPRDKRISYPVMMTVAAAMEAAAFAIRPFYAWTPVLTRSSVRFVCQTHTFDGSRAKRELGYEPLYSWDESLARTIAWWRDQEVDREVRSARRSAEPT